MKNVLLFPFALAFLCVAANAGARQGVGSLDNIRVDNASATFAAPEPSRAAAASSEKESAGRKVRIVLQSPYGK